MEFEASSSNSVDGLPKKGLCVLPLLSSLGGWCIQCKEKLDKAYIAFLIDAWILTRKCSQRNHYNADATMRNVERNNGHLSLWIFR